jgi:Homeodomain-like domain
VRCHGCGATQVLLPAALQPRRADSTEVIGTALARKAEGLGYRRIAAALGRSPSTVRRWLRRARDPGHLNRLWQRGAPELIRLDAEAFNELASTGNPAARHPDRSGRSRLPGRAGPPARYLVRQSLAIRLGLLCGLVFGIDTAPRCLRWPAWAAMACFLLHRNRFRGCSVLHCPPPSYRYALAGVTLATPITLG